MRTIPLLLLLPLSLPWGQLRAATDDDWSPEDWIDTPTREPTSLYASFTRDQQQNQTLSFGLSLPLGDAAGLSLFLDRSRLQGDGEDVDSSDIGGELGLRIDQRLQLFGGYRYQGQAGDLEIGRWSLGARLGGERLALRIDYANGPVTVYARDDLPPNWRVASSRDIDSERWTLQLDGGGSDWAWFATWSDFDYASDLSRIGSSALLQLILSPGALEQADLLPERQLRLGLQWLAGENSLGLQWAQSRNAVDGDTSDSLALDLSHPLSARMSLQFGVGHVLDSDQPWSLTAGLEWIAD